MINPTVEQNMKAARLCGWSDDEIEYSPPFTLSNPADMLATVKALGEKYHISPRPADNCWVWESTQIGFKYTTDPFKAMDTYEEAVLAALDSLEVRK